MTNLPTSGPVLSVIRGDSGFQLEQTPVNIQQQESGWSTLPRVLSLVLEEATLPRVLFLLLEEATLPRVLFLVLEAGYPAQSTLFLGKRATLPSVPPSPREAGYPAQTGLPPSGSGLPCPDWSSTLGKRATLPRHELRGPGRRWRYSPAVTPVSLLVLLLPVLPSAQVAACLSVCYAWLHTKEWWWWVPGLVTIPSLVHWRSYPRIAGRGYPAQGTPRRPAVSGRHGEPPGPMAASRKDSPGLSRLPWPG